MPPSPDALSSPTDDHALARRLADGLAGIQMMLAFYIGGMGAEGQNYHTKLAARMGLGDAALIKDNHVAAAGSVVAALRAVRAAAPDLPCEVEVDSLEQLDAVLGEGVQLILLDDAGFGLDSVDLLDLLVACEREMGLELPHDLLLDDAMTVGDLIQKLRNAAAAG